MLPHIFDDKARKDSDDIVKLKMLPRFRLKNEIGSGSFGKVYKESWNGELVAVKILRDGLFDSNDTHGHVQKFHDECKILQRLRHKNVVQLKEFIITHTSPPMLITELLDCDLVKYIGRLYPRKIPFPETVSIALDVAEGLAYLHRQKPPIVHRDLATKNVLLTRNKQAKIADLGIAKCFSLQEKMFSSPNCGTPAYAAPETFSTKQAQKVVYGVKIDIFSFGVMLMEVVNSTRPKMEPDWPFDKGLYIFFCIQVSSRQNESRLYLCWSRNPPQRVTAQKRVDVGG